MSKAYNFTIDASNARWTIKIDPAAGYGYFERNSDGSGGGLWFEGKELTDYDGMGELPRTVGASLVAADFIVGTDFVEKWPTYSFDGAIYDLPSMLKVNKDDEGTSEWLVRAKVGDVYCGCGRES